MDKVFGQEPENKVSHKTQKEEPSYISDAELEAKKLTESLKEHERK